MYMCNPNGCHIHNVGTWFILSPCESDVKSSCSQVNENYWDLTFQAMLGKLYVISLFVTLWDAIDEPSRFTRTDSFIT